jgi:hypothetical protein
MTHTESTPITARYVVTFGSYDDAFELGSYASEDAALIAAAQHCRTHIEMWHRMPDPFTVERVEDHEPTPTSFDERALAEGDATAAERANAARSWLLDAIDDRPEGAYEGRFFAGEVPIFEYLLSLVPIELEADEQATDEGVCPFCDETHELFFDDVREHDAARDRARAAREDAAPQPAPFDERVLAESDAITDAKRDLLGVLEEIRDSNQAILDDTDEAPGTSLHELTNSWGRPRGFRPAETMPPYEYVDLRKPE